MIKEITVNNLTIIYTLEYKNVKNINLRIRSDCTVYVSANRRVPQSIIDEFVISKSDFILKAMKKYENNMSASRKRYFSEDEIKAVILELCNRVYPYFEKKGVKYPQIKFRRMVSRWGSCHPSKGILTFNTNLMYAPSECIEYVVIHEFTHFLQANHSAEFYKELAKTCPVWKICRNMLREINIR